MIFIFVLIALIASMNMISLLYTYITFKKTDIALLQLLGMSKQALIILFLIFSNTITALASSFGLLVAYILGFLLKKYPCITLPDVYYVSHIPIEFDYTTALIIFLGAQFLSCCCAYLPLQSLTQVTITHTLRFE